MDEIRLSEEGSGHDSEIWTEDPGGGRVVAGVTTPSLTPVLPDAERATGSAVVVAPGGGFANLQWDKEGIAVANWLSERGIAAFVLKYRLMTPDPALIQTILGMIAAGDLSGFIAATRAALNRTGIVPLALADGRSAMNLVRSRAAEWGLDPERIGLMGFSAGAVLTAGVALDHDAQSRPSFVAPIYGAAPAVLDPSVSLPPTAAGELPPLFTMIANNDFPELVEGSLDLVRHWRAAGRPVEMHLYSDGGHGFGLRPLGLPVDTWIDRFGDWLRALGHLTRP